MSMEHEEDKTFSSTASWAIIAIFCAAIIGWGVLTYRLVKDGPRRWDFQNLPDVPAQSIYSSQDTPKGQNVPAQIPPLPEARPKNLNKEASTQP